MQHMKIMGSKLEEESWEADEPEGLPCVVPRSAETGTEVRGGLQR